MSNYVMLFEVCDLSLLFELQEMVSPLLICVHI